MNLLRPGWKYVVIEHPDFAGLCVPVLLPPSGLGHKAVAQIGRPVSAGFCEVNEKAVKVWGESAGLALGVRVEADTRLLRRCFYPDAPTVSQKMPAYAHLPAVYADELR